MCRRVERRREGTNTTHERFYIEDILVEFGRGGDIFDHETGLEDVGDRRWDGDVGLLV